MAAPTYLKALTLRDVVVINIVAVVGLRWIARGARAGAPSVVLWVLACVVFFLPLAATIAELSSRHPDEGGLYTWARRAFGPVHGFVCGWCLWINNLFYFPSLLLFAAANLAGAFGPEWAWLAEHRLYSTVFVLGCLWGCIALNILGYEAGRWLQWVGAIGTWIPAGLVIACGAWAFAAFGSATSFAPAALVPRDDVLSTLGLWSAMCFAFSGFEISTLSGEEVRDARRTIPRGVLIAGAMTTVMYVAGSGAVLVAVPADALTERSGLTDAVEIVSARVGLAGLGALTGILLAASSVAGVHSWSAGAARIPFVAGIDRALPAALGRQHPRHQTPHVALITQGVAATLLFLASVFLTIGGEASIQDAYDILVNLTILIYFVPYLYLFASLIVLRRREGQGDGDTGGRVLRIPLGTAGLWMAALSGGLATAISMGLVFVPPTGVANVLNYEVNLVMQAAAVIGVGLGCFAWSRRTS